MKSILTIVLCHPCVYIYVTRVFSKSVLPNICKQYQYEKYNFFLHPIAFIYSKMEPVGAFLAEELCWLNRMFSGQESDFMANVHCHSDGSGTFNYGSSSTFWPTDEAIMNVDGPNESLFVSSDTVGTNYFSQETSNNSGCNSSFFSTPGENHFAADINLLHGSFNIPESMDFCTMDSGSNFAFPHFPENFMEETLPAKEEMENKKVGTADSQPMSYDDIGKEMQLKRKFDAPELHAGEDEQDDLPKAPKKKPRVARNAQKGKKTAVAKRNQKISGNANEEAEIVNTVTNVQSSSSCSSENDSNASQELKEGETSDSKASIILNSDGKARASRGAATDPQSLYARKRRERINERLRILQNLVPNGTKVDISTMLEEAIDYVKFLQLQIKLLSSDDMWMYAPIAYNGMDMGLYEKISRRAL